MKYRKYIIILFITISGLDLNPIFANTQVVMFNVIDSFDIYRSSMNDKETWYLAKRKGVFAHGSVIVEINRYALWNNFIVGTTLDSFFIFDSSKDWVYNDNPIIFKEQSGWEHTLKEIGINSELELLDPDDVAKTRKNQELQPWNYILMRNFFGLSDPAWGLILILFILVFCFFMGILNKRRKYIQLFPILLGVFVGYINFYLIWSRLDVVIGPFILAFLGCPFLCGLSAHIGLKFSKRCSGVLVQRNTGH